MIAWPCILKLVGDDELIYLDSLDYLNSECADLIFCEDDCVIDSEGHCYQIVLTPETFKLIKLNRSLSSNEVTDLIRAHEFNKVSVCLTKIYFLTISDAIRSLAS